MSGESAPDRVTVGVTEQLRALTARDPSPRHLHEALRLLAKWRSHVLAQSVLERHDGIVQRGPFAGMRYLAQPSEGALIARLLGIYEASLTPVIERIIAGGYGQVLDIGSAEGYYAVGLALRMPAARILAYEIDPRARALLASLAQQNGVGDRIERHEECTHASFDICHDAKSVVICDIEGAEDQLLDPEAAPGLREADILVETHPGLARGVTQRLQARFAHSHRITQLGRAVDSASLPDWMAGLDDMDRLVALWEWRSAPTPWLWMTRK